ncbi:MAG: AraC family transcriptional regulator [Devosia sp.]|nr:AraC family transcriptional regulator [Devosia sp.]
MPISTAGQNACVACPDVWNYDLGSVLAGEVGMSLESLIDPEQGFVFGENHMNSGGRYGPLQRSYVTLIMLHAGAARIVADGQELSMVAGECAVVVNRHSVLITYQQHLRTHASWCEAHPRAPARGQQPTTEVFEPKLRISERLLRLQRMGIELGLDSASALNTFRNALGQAVFGAYLLESRLLEDRRRVPAGLLRARRFIDAHYFEACSLERLADVAALTPTHLVAAFRKHFGTTPIRQLWVTRGLRAYNLLLRSTLTNAEIAFQCGYKNPYHFSRRIKEQFGRSPSELRASKGYRVPSDQLERTADVPFR